MPLFLTSSERDSFHAFRRAHAVGQDLHWALLNRAEARAASPGHHGPAAESEWWFSVAEYLTDAAMAHALHSSERLAAWIRAETLSLVRRPVADWVGPTFRNHGTPEPMGHLETAHLSWAVAVALDLAADLFTDAEREEIRACLRERAIPMCRRWLDRHHHLANWRCVLGAGAAVAAAVLDDREEIARCVADYQLSLHVFQPDGSYAESLQYSNYAAYTLMLAREALLRRDPALADKLPAAPWNHLPRWQAASLFYRKPLSRWGAASRARSANFNDSGAIFRPSADLLLHLAAREQSAAPAMAGLARWLFDTLYAPDLVQGPHDGATFGFINDWGFLAIPLLPAAAAAIPPAAAGLGPLETFSCGDVLARDAWPEDGGRTILAVHGGGDLLHGPGHLHGDLNSFILVHNRERLLVDPGHSCYRNAIHDFEGASRTHNTCTFLLEHDPERPADSLLEQTRSARSSYDPTTRLPNAFPDRGARRLLAARRDEVTVIASEAAALYGPAIRQFTRFWILCGPHALFVVDRIVSTKPVRTQWHWLLNNRDGALELKTLPDRLVARRGSAGLKLFHLGQGSALVHPQHAFVHDAYHPQPGGLGEGVSDTGRLVGWRESRPATERTVVHALAVDGYGPVAGWHLKQAEDGSPILESPDASVRWCLSVAPDATTLTVRELVSARAYTASSDPTGAWSLR